MCGIAGIYHSDERREATPDRGLVKSMTDRIIHRGPDEGSEHLEPGVGFGHRRLSIIDVATGQQPLFNEDGSVVVVFNGEIYNYAEVVPELEAAGHVFKTKSDTEVIVHAWEQWGVDCLERFRGMFAFALWDRNKRSLFMARDRMGVKPLYYGFTRDGDLLFGSELKALTVHPKLTLQVDEAAVRDYLTLGYVPDPKSIYASVSKLAPAHFLLLKRGEKTASPKCYWRPNFKPDHTMQEQEAIAELDRIMVESVRLRMISEVPLGAFLSGGVDSSVVVANMAALSNAPVKTCSIGFDQANYDETQYASEVAKQYKTDHIVHRVTSDDYGLIDTLAKAYDEPFADSSAIPTYRVSQLARERVTVALSGDGGDETFGGYRRYRFHLGEEKMRSMLPYSLRAPVFSALASVYPQAAWMPRFLRARATFNGMAAGSVEAYTNSVSLTKPKELNAMLSKEFRNRLGGYETLDLMEAHARNAQTDDPLSLIQYLDYQTYLPGDINTKVDRASMQHSLETREPLMDHKLIEFAASIPSSLKIKNGEGKYILKKAYENRLSHDLLYRPKMGFGVPIADWFKNQLKDEIHQKFSSGALCDSGMFDMTKLRGFQTEHELGVRDHSPTIWSVLMLERFLTSN
jgi:asparagine synthase (glutamine-hydrolysing)